MLANYRCVNKNKSHCMANQNTAVLEPSSGQGIKAWPIISNVSLCKTQSYSGLVLKINYGLDGAWVLINKSKVVIHFNGLRYLIFRLNKIENPCYSLFALHIHEY